jgi:manganese oxidase
MIALSLRALCLLLLAGLTAAGSVPAVAQNATNRTISVQLVALDQPVMINRLGAARPGGMIFALRSDVVSIDGGTGLLPGRVRLRDDKRPRPVVLRANVGDQLVIHFQNLLYPEVADQQQPATRWASVHIAGMQLVDSMSDDGSLVGANPIGTNKVESGLVPPGGSTTYRLLAEQEGSFLLYSPAADFNGFSQTQLMLGLFGAVNVQPAGAEWYRSQVSQEDLALATSVDSNHRRKLTPSGQPIIEYNAVYPPSHRRAGLPILKMLGASNELVHSDLTAIITGPNHGRFPNTDSSPGFGPNPATPDRRQPYREVTVHYHESQDVIQAFPFFYTPVNTNTPTVNAGQDSFAINYGIAGIGAEVVANRVGVGPSRECVECKFEEFFLSSWAGGDPSLLVDVPANAPNTTAKLEAAAGKFPDPNYPPPGLSQGDPRPKATKAFYPDDPSNVYHSYLGDHVRFRILHAGVSVHHVHHHHAHQWLRTPNSDDSQYLDSQAIGPGSSFTLELVYNGSGNRNLTVGDSIFHCHFYPHFASGMWALYRVHDVLETGTPLDQNGRPRRNSRALPDGEIAAGTPIPAVVPIPTIPMPPLPAPVSIEEGQVVLHGDQNPGYPFFVPGQAGHRPPHPPYDFAVGADQKPLDGGLPRHLIVSGTVTNEQHTPVDFSKDLGLIVARQLPEDGTPAEKSAISYFSQRRHPSYTSEGQPADFIVNGLPQGPQHGAPFADPAVDDQGKAVGGKVRRYKGASLQVDNVFNKSGWHYPQQRMMALWQDVADLSRNVKPPEPLFFRANSGDVVEFWHANLIPAYYELDDFQVRTPTDIIGQHIHLVKFDVMASDGAANGFNYEDGTFSPQEVRSRINGINLNGGLWTPEGNAQTLLAPKAIPELGNGPTPDSQEWLGAQATVQRWYIDPLLNNQKVDRTYMTVFTHDHFGPSTHQMAGLYGALLTEPAGSQWTRQNGEAFGTRDDGGPTSYAARVLPPEPSESYREFALMFQDLQLAYLPTSKSKPDVYVPGSTAYQGWADPANVINSPKFGTSGNPNPPKPYLVSDFGAGIFSMNYRNEPLPLRVAPGTNASSSPFGGDLAHAFRSIERSNIVYSTQPTGGDPIDPNQKDSPHRFPVKPISDGMLPQDPYTPLLQAFENDPIQIRAIAGAHTSMHDLTIHGVKWLAEPKATNSGYRNSQLVLLSEHYEMLFTLPRTRSTNGGADYLYSPSASYEGLINGLWGILRAYSDPALASNLQALPNNPVAALPPALSWHSRLPKGLPTNSTDGSTCLRTFSVSAISVAQALGGSSEGLVYNSRGLRLANGFAPQKLQDPNAIIYVLDDDLDLTSSVPRLLHPGKIEPLVLRVAAGDFIEVTLVNRFAGNEAVFTRAKSASRPGQQIPYANAYLSNSVLTSASVGLHPQLLAYDVTSDDGANVGRNPVQTVRPGGQVRYRWYAGEFVPGPDRTEQARPIEFGAVNLLPADPLMHVYHSLFGAMVVQPKGSTWVEDADSHLSATVSKRDGSHFREFVLIAQDDIALHYGELSLYGTGNPLSAFNYRTEPFFYRYGELLRSGLNPQPKWADLSFDDLSNINQLATTGFDTHRYAANSLVGQDPQTPVFRASAGTPVRFRLLCPGGIGDNQQVFELHGHVWQQEPYRAGSTEIGNNPKSPWTGTTPGFGTTSHFDIVIDSAGGKNRVPGDYLFRSATASQFQVGLWGILRVTPADRAQVSDGPERLPTRMTSTQERAPTTSAGPKRLRTRP